ESRDPVGRVRARELVRVLLDLHAAGLARMLESARGRGGLVEAWTQDREVASLLLLHGVHPTPLTTRVQEALGAVEEKLAGLGARIAVRTLEGDALRLRLEIGGGCGANPGAVRALVEDAVCAAAPDVALAIELVEAEARPSGFVPLAQLTVRRA